MDNAEEKTNIVPDEKPQVNKIVKYIVIIGVIVVIIYLIKRFVIK